MINASQVLAIIGIGFEVLSFLNQARFYYLFKSKKERQLAYIDTLGKSTDTTIKEKLKEEKRLLLTLFLLGGG